MERVRIEDVESRGESFAFGYHAHGDQEEVFYVQEGTVTFETADGQTEVESGEAVRFAPGEYQRGVNRGENRVVALAMGAPKESTDLDMRRDCLECDDRTANAIELAEGGDALVTICEDCGAETGRFD